MIIAPDLLSPAAVWWLGLLQLAIVAVSVWRAPWREVLSVPRRQHLLFGALIVLTLLWQVSGRIAPQVHLHLLGITSVTLMLGVPLTILVGTAACLVDALIVHRDWMLIGANALFNATVPALVSAAVLHAILRYGPRNLFAYMLGAGFGGGALSMLAVMLVMLVIFALTGQTRAFADWASPLLLLAMFPEGFVNGAVVSSLAVYKPHWLRSYDDHYFLDGV
jgi:uncharacterized membrane protein